MAAIPSLEPIPPGEILREEFLAPMGLTATALAAAVRMSPGRIGEILRGRRAITAETALRLGRFFGTSAEMWLNLQRDYELRVARRQAGDRIEREVQPRAA